MSQETQVTSRRSPEAMVDDTISRGDAWQVAGNLFVSFKYAWAGIAYAFTTQRNFRIHSMMGTIALGLGIYLGLEAVAIAIIGLTVASVMALELLNTALESVVDLAVGQAFHNLAKIAKDCAAGAVLVAAMAAVGVAGLLILPALLAKLHLWAV